LEERSEKEEKDYVDEKVYFSHSTIGKKKGESRMFASNEKPVECSLEKSNP